MQIEITPQIAIATVGIGLALQSAIIAVAVMVRGTAKDLAREQKERDEAEKAVDARFAVVEREMQTHAVAIRALEVRAEAADRAVGSLTSASASHAQALATLDAARAERRRR